MAVLDKIVPDSVRARVAPLLNANRRVVIAGGGALAAAVVAVTILWSVDSGYSVLFAGLDGEEGGRTLAELQKLNIPYRITEGGRVILVPAGDVGRARLQLAARGVPKNGHDAWTLFDNQSLSVSPFAEQVHYVRAVEKSLAHSIQNIDGVVSAQVMLGLPKQTSFLADTPKASASVLLRLRPGVQLTSAQIDGVVGLVAASVPGLSRDNVSVTDQSGRALTQSGTEALQQLPQQLELVRATNRRYEAMIADLLTPVLGKRNFRISADADLDFSKTKESQIKYGAAHVLSQDETTHIRPNDMPAIGIPGALSNRPPETPTTQVTPPAQPPAAQSPAGQTPPANAAAGTAEAGTEAKPAPPVATDNHKTTNYDIDRTVQYSERPAWTLRAINVAVLVNNPSASPLPAERIQAIDKLVAAAIGSARTPRVTVVDMPFDDAAADSAPGGMGPWWRHPAMSAAQHDIMLALAGLLVLWGGMLPMLRRLEQMRAALPAPRPRGAIVAANVNVSLGPQPRRPSWLPGGRREAAQPEAAASPVFRIEPETVRLLAANDPARTAQVIKGWISNDRNSNGDA